MRRHFAMLLSIATLGCGTVHRVHPRSPFISDDAREAPAIECTNWEAAFMAVLEIDDWSSLYDHFQRYPHCDEGAIAEGYSDSTAHLLATSWIGEAGPWRFLRTDAAFQRFLIKHIDPTADEPDLRQALANTVERCPNHSRRFCRVLRRKASTALEDFALPPRDGPVSLNPSKVGRSI